MWCAQSHLSQLEALCISQLTLPCSVISISRTGQELVDLYVRIIPLNRILWDHVVSEFERHQGLRTVTRRAHCLISPHMDLGCKTPFTELRDKCRLAANRKINDRGTVSIRHSRNINIYTYGASTCNIQYHTCAYY